ncbi:MAG: hypothetical protein UZ22_OP11002001047 [Microgenomates bacterium OLB23]|nr:MAG: hypothetical protein UZ22_OP11002001047 [Microgenomates bacterium OLB23]
MKNLSLFALILVIFLACTGQAYAGQYGPYEGKKPALGISIDKKVGLPHTATKGGQVEYTYVDNLTSGDRRFAPQEYVFFEIKVKNTSKVQLNNVVIRDYAPHYVELFENPGSFEGKDIVLNVGTLQPGEEKVYVFKARIMPQNQLPADKGVVCTYNKVRASNDRVADEDTAQFCIEKSVTSVNPPTDIPKTGPEHGVLIMISAAGSALAGLKLRRMR